MLERSKKGEMMVTITIGDRVCFNPDRSIKGTIKNIFLHSRPYFVVWDNGGEGWYDSEDIDKE